MIETFLNRMPPVARSAHHAEAPVDFDEAVRMVRSGRDVHQVTSLLLAATTDQERLWMLDGDLPFWNGLRGILFDRYNRTPFIMGAIPRLSVPGIRFTDGPRGIVMNSSTCFPVAMARGATWDIALEQRIGNAMGLEGRAQGANHFAGICINLPRHPAWGRIQETYGEDPILLGEFGVALHRGVRPHLMTCVKHFALNSMENARFSVDVWADDAAIHEVYLPHFRRLVEEGVSSVMSSYNSVRGEFAGQNHELLNTVLRQEWRFDGFVLSDFIFGFRDAVKSVTNGLDVEAPFQQQRSLHLPQALERGDLAWSGIDQSCERILRKQLEHEASRERGPIDPAIVFCAKHRKLAREAAGQAMVLLKNEVVNGQPLLPLNAAKIHRLAMVGRLGNRANTGDRGSSAVFSPSVTTFYDGLITALPNTTITLDDTDNAESAANTASSADVVICVVGYEAADEGEYVVPSFHNHPELLNLLPPALTSEDAEVRAAILGQIKSGNDDMQDTEGLVPGAGGDRSSLRLREQDVEIINAVSRVSPNVIVCVVAAGAVLMSDWIHRVPSVLMTWYSGCEGGHALADVLLGRVDASGRLPFSIPASESHLPPFDMNATKVTYDPWYGQRLLDKLNVKALFPLGHGLSYSTYVLEDLVLETNPAMWAKEQFTARVNIVNTGTRPGRHVVQVYGSCCVPDFASRVLLGFQSVEVGLDHPEAVQVKCSIRPLKRRVKEVFVLAASTVSIEAASYAGDSHSLRATLALV